MYALVDIQGKQYKAVKGSRLRVDRLEQAQGETLRFDSVLLTSDEGRVSVGAPFVSGAAVTAVVEGHELGRKVMVIKFRRRKHYHRTRGHRQKYTMIRIESIEGAPAGA
jgi:large subunit ribosomal protein L21